MPTTVVGLPLPVTPPALSLSTAATEVVVDDAVSAVYVYIDDATTPPIGEYSTDGTNFGPVAGREWELIYTRGDVPTQRVRSLYLRVSAGTATAYLRVY